MTQTTTATQWCSECGRQIPAFNYWFNGMGPICGLCFSKFTKHKEAPKKPEAQYEPGVTDWVREEPDALPNPRICECPVTGHERTCRFYDPEWEEPKPCTHPEVDELRCMTCGVHYGDSTWTTIRAAEKLGLKYDPTTGTLVVGTRP